ncbi:MAG: TonB-dependent receptor [Gammaproteobacteria bacterium]|nr:TonB-dependent receptor [Gammaproteobacteria bacterium]
MGKTKTLPAAIVLAGGGSYFSVICALLGVLALFPLTPAGAQGQDSAAGVFEEIVVTARKREESLEEIPVALTAFTEDDIANLNMGDLYDVGKNVPNLVIGNFGNGNHNHTSVFMRGVGTQDHIITVDSAVGLYLDGVYLGRQVGSNLALSNIERVEVARGPQGTLHGRNSIGGAVNVITKKPTGEEEATLTAQGGTRARGKFDFYGSTALSEQVAASVTGFYNRRDGVGEFINQPNTDVELGQIREAGGRAMLNFMPSDDFSLLLSADFSDGSYGQTPTYFNAPPGQFPNGLAGNLFAANPDDNASPADQIARQTSQAYGFSATADWALTDVYALKFIGSYRFSDYTGGTDQQDSIGAVVFPERGEADQYSAELQLLAEFANWNFVTGAYYFTEDGETVSRPFEIFPATSGITDGEINVTQDVESYAWFGSVDYAVTSALTIGGGLRVTHDSKDATGVAALFQPAIPVARAADWTELSWDASATYTVTDDVNFYMAFSRGYQSGGFPARPFGGDTTFVSFDPQFAQNYEGGFKGVLAGRLRFAATVFWTDYTDLQLQTNRFTPGLGFLTITENAGESRAWGVEFEGNLQVNDYFSVQTAVGYLDAEFTEVDPAVAGTVKGMIPQLTTDWTFSISPELTLPMNGGAALSLRLNYNYRGDMYGEANNVPLNRVSSRELLDFNIRYQPADPSWHLVLYGENILNEVYDTASGTFGNPFSITLRSNDRSEFGVRISKSFGG